MIGPTRLTLVGGRTLDGIGVIREPDRIRLIQEDGAEIVFDPAKVASVKALADIEGEPQAPVVGKEKTASGSKSSSAKPQRGAARTRSGAQAAKQRDAEKSQDKKAQGAKAAQSEQRDKSAQTVQRGRASLPWQQAAPPPGSQGTPRSGKGWGPPMDQAGASQANAVAPARGSAAKTADPPATGVGAKSGGAPATATPKRTGGEDAEELARMLEQAIERKDRELERGGGLSAEEGGEGDGSVAGEGEGEGLVEGAAGLPKAEPGGPPAEGAGVPKGPNPELFDATVPVKGSGFRYIGPGKGPAYPQTPPVDPDFPKAVPPVTSLGPSIWKPTSGYLFPVKWPGQLAPATSFNNRLSGWGKPVTSLGPSWWAPTPTKWSTTLGFERDIWTPTDGFAQSQQSGKEPPAAKPEGQSTGGQGK